MKLKPGPELDRIVSEKIFKRKHPTRRQMARAAHKLVCTPKDVAAGQWWVPDLGGFMVRKTEKGRVTYTPEIPRFSEKLEDAWQLVNYMRSERFNFSLYHYRNERPRAWFVCPFGFCKRHKHKTDNTHGADVTAETVPMAICMAALKALRV